MEIRRRPGNYVIMWLCFRSNGVGAGQGGRCKGKIKMNQMYLSLINQSHLKTAPFEIRIREKTW